MIVPRKIISLTSLLLLPALAVPLLPGGGLLLTVLAAGTLLAAAGDLLALCRRQRIVLTVPPILRGSQQRTIGLAISLENPDSAVTVENLIMQLPTGLSSDRIPEQFKLAAAGCSRLDVNLLSKRRGVFRYGDYRFDVVSPLGLWCRRHKALPEGEIRIYPDVFSEHKKMAALFLNRGYAGLHLRRQAGQGREFERLRDYVHGDSYDQIAWKPTARRGHPVCRVFQLENTQRIYAVIDASRFSMNEKSGRSNLDHYLAAALNLGAVADKQKDAFGVIVFNSQIRAFVPAMTGTKAARICRDAIFAAVPEDTAPDYNGLFSFIRARIARRSLLFFLTDLSDAVTAEDFVRDVRLISRKHLCMVDMLEHEGIRPLFDQPANDPQEIYMRLAGHLKWTEQQARAETLSRLGIGFNASACDSLSINLVNTYLDIKRKQLL
ncbi:MAG: DUF58 domain-containing protein [Victivallaceae bacterium]